jgi:penicillin-binding protein 2
MRWPWRTIEYRIPADRDEWAAPEEALIDYSSDLSTVEVPVSDTIFRISHVLVILFSVILVGACARLAVAKYSTFAQISWRNRTVNVSVPPPRGIIMDRTGVPLVQNVPSFDLLVISRQVRRSSDGTFTDIGIISSMLEREPEELTLYLNDGISQNAVFFLATDLTRGQVLSLAHVIPPGFYLITSTKREYVDGPQFAHVVGYVGKVSRADMAKDSYYLPSDTVGRLGIEAAYEDVLRGTHGQLVFSSSEQATSLPARGGGNLSLNIDAQVQKALFSSIYGILRESGLDQAAAVVQDPRSGAVLAMASFPTYDNNIFTGQLSQANADLLFNSHQRPLFNRAIAGLYNPGSTIKPFVGMAGLAEHVMTPTQVLANDCIELTVPNPRDPDHPYVFKNWRPDTGPFTLYRAIADSCNIYFFTVGGGYGNISGLGATRLISYLQKGLADSILGVDLPGEEHGFIPTPDWKYQNKKEPWYQGDTYNISIGQGDLLVTPLWINTYVSAIANGGTLWQPMVASRIVDDQIHTVTTYSPRTLGTLPFSPEVIRTMQAAMRGTVTDGTARIFQDLPVTAAAKTGTAEVIKGQRINSLVTVYAPAQDPQIALTVLIEGSASNQGYALRAAHQFLQWYFSRP